MSGTSLLLELGIVIAALAVAARLAGRLGVPTVPLYLLAGLVIGNSGLLPLEPTKNFIASGAQIGLVLMLLMLGLEYSATDLVDGLRTSVGAGVFDLVANFTPGFVAGLVVGFDVLDSVLLGGVTYVSSSGIAAKVIDEFGWIANREIPVVLSILVIEDLAMAVYLPLVAALLASGGGTAGAALRVLVSVAVALVILRLATSRAGLWMSRAVFHRSDEVLLLALLGVTFVVAGAAERVHVSAAVGAFLVGIALSGPAAEGARILLAPLRDLFAAVFFVFFALQVDASELPPIAGVAAVLVVVTVLTKAATGWWSARHAGRGVRARWRTAMLLVARGEFSIVIAGLAVAAGAHERFGALATGYVLAVAIAGPLLARASDGWGRWHAARQQAES